MQKNFSICLTMLLSFNFLYLSCFTPDEMLTYVKPLLPENPVVLESGGRFGDDTKRMKLFWPGATMHVFEALPTSFEKMVENTQCLEGIMYYPCALSSHSGTTEFYIDIENVGASSINYPVEFNEHEFDKIPIIIPCTTLDNWASQNKISYIDFMWLDMEGHELYVLQHASSILETVKAIYTEVNFVPTREGCCLYEDLKRFLESKGFCEVMKRSVGRFGDCLFVRSSLLE